MSVITKEGIGYSARTKAAYILPAGNQADGKKFTTPVEKDQVIATPYADWGSSNDLPIKMAKDIEECGVLSAALDAKARIAVGKGPMPFLLMNVDKEGKEDLEFVDDSEIHDWLELNDSFAYSINSMFDRCAYGWSPLQLLLSRNRKKINRIRRTDVVTARLEKRNKATGLIDNIYLSADWSCQPLVNSEYVKKIPILEEGGEYFDLQERASGYEFAIINRQLRNGRGYYPPPLWYSAKRWVDIAKGVPAMKTAMFNNQMTIKYLVTISAQYWKRVHSQWDTYTPQKRQEVMDAKLDEIDKYLAGSENQYKSIFANSYIDPVTKTATPDIAIEVLDDKVKDGKLLPDSAAANSEILFAIMINPALMGAGQPGGPYSSNAGGSNIRESYLTQIMLLEWERRDNARIFNIIKQFNGWSQRLEVERTTVSVAATPETPATEKKIKPRLVFRYPSGVLTTLDTGKSTKGEVL
jgi:hypothetical protein